DLLLQALDLAAHLMAQPRVEVRERLIEEQDVRPLDQRARERDALLLAAGELRGPPVQELRDLYERRRFAHALVALRLRDAAAKLEREADVLRDRHVRVERVALEDHSDPPVLRVEMVHALVAEDDRAARRAVDPGDHEERRRLAAARGAEERDELARAHLEVELVHRGDIAELLCQVLE